MNIDLKLPVELLIYLATSLVYFGWRKLRGKDRLGALVGRGKIAGAYIPHKAVFALTEYVLSLVTMAVVSASNSQHFAVFYYLATIVLVGIYEIRDLVKTWNTVFIHERGIAVNNEEFVFSKMREVRMEEGAKTILVVNRRKQIEYVEPPGESQSRLKEQT